jgi:hypothetical protein
MTRKQSFLRKLGLVSVQEADALRESYNRETEYLLKEINKMRRVMQDAGIWDEFCQAYAEKYPIS